MVVMTFDPPSLFAPNEEWDEFVEETLRLADGLAGEEKKDLLRRLKKSLRRKRKHREA